MRNIRHSIIRTPRRHSRKFDSGDRMIESPVFCPRAAATQKYCIPIMMGPSSTTSQKIPSPNMSAMRSRFASADTPVISPISIAGSIYMATAAAQSGSRIIIRTFAMALIFRRSPAFSFIVS